MLMLYFALIDSEADQLRFSDIYSNYQKQMLLVAKRILHSDEDAEDAVQIAFLGIAQRIKSLPVDDRRLRAYVLTAAKNAALSLLPQKKRQDNMLDIDELPIASDEDLFVKVMQSRDYDTLLRAARMLPAPYREVLLIICVEGQTVAASAAILHRKHGTVRQQLNRGKKLLIDFCRKEGMCFEEQG